MFEKNTDIAPYEFNDGRVIGKSDAYPKNSPNNSPNGNNIIINVNSGGDTAKTLASAGIAVAAGLYFYKKFFNK